jgi:mono/diheme cytochrome c family protein
MPSWRNNAFQVPPHRPLILPVVIAFALAACKIAWGADVPNGSVMTTERQDNPLVWDATEKTIEAKPGDSVAEFTFTVTNKSPHAVTIQNVHTSCGCTVAQLPATPWVIAPGAGGIMKVTLNFAGKDGRVMKTAEVDSSEGLQTLLVTVNIPGPDEQQREHNRQLALVNRQAVFRGDCATCHAAAIGAKKGAELFQATCAICHVSAHRASMVADLLTARDHRDAEFWRKWITEGREGSLMPAFAQSRGGPLTDSQVASLVEFALQSFPTEPRPKE